MSLLEVNASPRVLLVEHDAHTRERHAAALTAAGFHAIGIGDAEQAFEQAAAMRPAIVVADLELGDGLDGLELCERLKAHADTRPIAVIILTRRVEDHILERAERAGCVSVKIKPDVPGELVALVLRTLQGATTSISHAWIDADAHPPNTFSVVAHRRHAGGLLVAVRYWNEWKNEKFSIAFSGEPRPEPLGPAFFGTVQMAKEAADDLLRTQGHVCGDWACAEWRDGSPLTTPAHEPQDPQERRHDLSSGNS